MDFTPAQNMAIERIADILREHFDGGLVAVVADADDHREISTVFWHGGGMRAMGLAVEAKLKLLQRNRHVVGGLNADVANDV